MAGNSRSGRNQFNHFGKAIADAIGRDDELVHAIRRGTHFEDEAFVKSHQRCVNHIHERLGRSHTNCFAAEVFCTNRLGIVGIP